MPDEPSNMIRFRGIFSFSDVMKAIKKWLVDRDYEFNEPTHKWKVPAEGVEAEIKITGDRKLNEYVKYWITVGVKTWDMRDVEVVKDGQKMKLQEGKIAIEVGGKYDLDWQKRFGGSKFLQGLQDFMHKFILKQDIGQKWEDDLFFQMVDLTKVIREKLGHEVIA